MLLILSHKCRNGLIVNKSTQLTLAWLMCGSRYPASIIFLNFKYYSKKKPVFIYPKYFHIALENPFTITFIIFYYQLNNFTRRFHKALFKFLSVYEICSWNIFISTYFTKNDIHKEILFIYLDECSQAF